MIKNNWALILIVLVGLILRLYFIAPYLEDWDSVQFALAINNFSLIDHQPHPPGYPVYVVLAKAINYLIRNEHLSLTFISIILGSLTAIPFYLLTYKMTNKIIATFSTILLLVTPVSWTLSEVALTNIPGMAFLITTAYLLFIGRISNKYLLWGSFLGGLTLGVRFAEYSIIIPLIALVMIFRKGVGTTKVLLTFSLGVSTWLFPLIIDTGFSNFLSAYTTQADYIVNHDSILSTGSALKLRLVRLKELLSWGYSIFFIPLVGLIILKVVTNIKSFINFNGLFAFVWLMSYLTPLIFAYNLEVTRYTLPLLPPLILLSAVAIHNSKNKILLPIYIISILGIFLNGFSQVKHIRDLIPPNISQVLYIKKNYNPSDTTLITSFTYRQLQYYAPEYKIYYDNLEEAGNLNTKYLILDYIGLQNSLPILSKYKLVDEQSFTGPEIIFPRIPKTNMYIFERKN